MMDNFLIKKKKHGQKAALHSLEVFKQMAN